MAEVKVKVVFRKAKGTYVLRWRCPETGSWKEKTAATATKRDADKLGAQLEADLQQGRYVEPSRTTWAEFRLRFEAEKLPSLAVKSQNAYKTALNRAEQLVHPEKLIDLDGPTLSRLQTRLRSAGLREATIAAYLRHVSAALRWGHDLGMLTKLPKVQMPKRARVVRQMRGRPVTGEELDRMMAACTKVRSDDAPAWKGFLTGLWLSGLRLSEALNLSWDSDSAMSLDFRGRYPCIRIMAEAEKGFQDRLLPITPDFGAFLDETPSEQRAGKVFAVAMLGLRLDTISKVISKIGETAAVVVNKEQRKFASAHDLWRAFGTRWAARVTPSILQRLMRHSSIETTLRYYVELDADVLAAELWRSTDRARAAQGSNAPSLND